MFLLINKLLINTDHIISATFTPAQPAGEDELDGPYAARPALLKIVTAELRAVELEKDYSQFHLAGASASQVHLLCGEEAERVWAALVRDAYRA